MYLETKTDGEAQQIGRDDFIAWLRTKNPREPYEFLNCSGRCAVGQYMADRGRPWATSAAYIKTCLKLGIDPYNSQVLCAGTQTFGALLQRMLALRAAS